MHITGKVIAAMETRNDETIRTRMSALIQDKVKRHEGRLIDERHGDSLQDLTLCR